MAEIPNMSYLINDRSNYIIYVNECAGKLYYKTKVSKYSKKDGKKTNQFFYRNLKFAQCNPPANNDLIRITKGFEDVYSNPRDKYNPVPVFVVLEWKPVVTKMNIQKNAYKDFDQEMKDFDLPF